MKTKSLSFESKKSSDGSCLLMRQKADSIRPKRPSRKYGTIVRNKASTLAKSFSFKSSKKHLIEKVDSCPPKQTRKFSLRKKSSKDKEDLYMEYRKKSLQILE